MIFFLFKKECPLKTLNLRHVCNCEHLGALRGAARGRADGGQRWGGGFFFFGLFWMMLKSLTQHYGNKVLTWIHKSKKFAVKGRCLSRAWCLMRWAVPARRGTNTQLCCCKCKGWAQQCRRTPGSWISCLCGFVMTPITALKLFLHVIYSRDVQFIFVLLAFFFMWKKKCIKIYKWSTIVFLATPQDSICSIQV